MSVFSPRADIIAELVIVAKVKLNDAYQVTNEATQMHGGFGVADELDVGFFLKRARSVIYSLGDSNYHKDRFATPNNY